MYFGGLWRDIPFGLGVYVGAPSERKGIEWKYIELYSSNGKYNKQNEELMELVKLALAATNGCFLERRTIDYNTLCKFLSSGK